MQWVIPGTTISTDLTDASQIESQMRSMFMAGGIVLSQVSSITGLECYAIQNWVKRGFLSKPEKKRYSLSQLCRIININMLKNALSLEQICGLLGYINGALDDESDDLIDDAELYFLFLRQAVLWDRLDNKDMDNTLKLVLADYRETVPGARERIENVLRIMGKAWAASQLRAQASTMIKNLT